MRALVRQAMEEGALGVGSSLIYAPAFYAKTDELIALCEGGGAVRRHVHLAHAQRRQPAARGGRRADHDRARGRACPAEIYHLKAAGEANWPKLDAGDREGRGGARARACGSPPTCTPTPPARPASTPRCRRGCRKAATRRGPSGCKDPAIRARVHARDAHADRRVGEPAARARARPRSVLLVGFKNDTLKPLTGKTLAEVARHARQVAGGDGDGPGDRGRQPRRHGLLPDVRGQRPPADRAAVGELRLRRRGAGAGGRVPQVEPAPARLRQLRAPARQVRARREASSRSRRRSAG